MKGDESPLGRATRQFRSHDVASIRTNWVWAIVSVGVGVVVGSWRNDAWGLEAFATGAIVTVLTALAIAVLIFGCRVLTAPYALLSEARTELDALRPTGEAFEEHVRNLRETRKELATAQRTVAALREGHSRLQDSNAEMSRKAHELQTELERQQRSANGAIRYARAQYRDLVEREVMSATVEIEARLNTSRAVSGRGRDREPLMTVNAYSNGPRPRRATHAIDVVAVIGHKVDPASVASEVVKLLWNAAVPRRACLVVVDQEWAARTVKDALQDVPRVEVVHWPTRSGRGRPVKEALQRLLDASDWTSEEVEALRTLRRGPTSS